MQLGERCEARGEGLSRVVLQPPAGDVQSTEGAQLRQSVEKATDASWRGRPSGGGSGLAVEVECRQLRSEASECVAVEGGGVLALGGGGFALRRPKVLWQCRRRAVMRERARGGRGASSGGGASRLEKSVVIAVGVA